MPSESINVNDYKIGELKRRAADDGKVYFYSVCGSHSNRKMVLIKKEWFSNKVKSKYKNLNEFCDYFYRFFNSVLLMEKRPPNV